MHESICMQATGPLLPPPNPVHDSQKEEWVGGRGWRAWSVKKQLSVIAIPASVDGVWHGVHQS